MARLNSLLIAGIGGIVLLVSLASGTAEWVGVGVAYLFTAVVFARIDTPDHDLPFRYGGGIFVGTLTVTALVNGVWISDQYTVTTWGFWDILIDDLVMPAVVAAVSSLTLTPRHRHHLAIILSAATLLGVTITEKVMSSVPYDGRATFIEHLGFLLGFYGQVVGGGIVIGLPLYLLLNGVPPTVDDWLAGRINQDRG